MKIIDAAGKPCPIPVVEAKKTLSVPGTAAVLVRVDNLTAVQNLEKMASGLGYKFAYSEGDNGLFEALIEKDGAVPATEDVPEPASGGNLVVLIGSDELGRGAPELGRTLIKGFIYSLSELEEAPSAVIFINRGAYLTAAGSNATDDLCALAKKGTNVLTCGTCVDYYGLGKNPAAGSITDMLGIVEKLAGAERIISI